MKPLNGKKIWFITSNNVYNCTSRQVKSTYYVFYDTDGKVIENVNNAYAAWTKVIPDTNGEIWFKAVCRYAFYGYDK